MKISSTSLIVFGTILLLGGIIGSVILLSNTPKVINNGRYRYIEKRQQIAVNPLETEQTISTIPTNTTPVISPVISKIVSIIPGATFIHSKVKPELENPMIPNRIEIPAIGLIAPVVISDYNKTKVEGETFGQWIAPSQFAAGWQPDSALLGDSGNTVINGHHNEFGEVFGNLVKIKVGDVISVFHDNTEYQFVVSNVMIVPERFQTVEVRTANAKWLARSEDVRLTLVTCWPKESNTHRLIIVSRPLFN